MASVVYHLNVYALAAHAVAKLLTATVVVTSVVLLSSLVFSASPHPHPERWYQEVWCNSRGEMEVVMPDGSRCDCLTETYAVEFDFARKWAESIGQALNYGAQSGKAPGVVLILEQPGDERYLRRVLKVRETYGLPLEVWAVDGEGKRLPVDAGSSLFAPGTGQN